MFRLWGGISRNLGRSFSTTRRLRFLPGAATPFEQEEEQRESQGNNSNGSRQILLKAGETAAVMIASLALLGLAGLCYHRGYLWHTHRKVSMAFDGWDEDLRAYYKARQAASLCDWVERDQQQLVDDIVSGKLIGRYYMLFGEKGTGKTSMMLSALAKVENFNVVSVEAHADPEIFRIRLGKALNFEFFEDYLGSLFSIRGPRENTAIMDIERALNVLEQVAILRKRKTKRPLVFIINSAHLIRDDEEGRNLVELLQQKAETLSGLGLATVVFNSDDYWLYERLKKLGTRLDVIATADFSRSQAIQLIKSSRARYFGQNISDIEAATVYHLVGGRAQHIAAVTLHKDMIQACHKLIDKEKQWFLNQCGLLGEDMDDDVMESGKFSTSAMTLAREMVRIYNHNISTASPMSDAEDLVPRIPLWRARQIMTRPDYIQDYDNLNIFTLDSYSRVKPDSMVMMHAFNEIASMPGFDELLEETMDRVAAIESLGRTREIVLKDLVEGGKYKFDGKYIQLEAPEESDHDDGDEHLLLDEGDRFYWKRRVPKGLLSSSKRHEPSH